MPLANLPLAALPDLPVVGALLPAVLPGPLVRLLPAPDQRDRVVVVTGASSGIGRATALRVSALGAHVVLVARREEVLEEVAEECLAAGASSAQVVPTDVADDDAVADLVAAVRGRHGRLDAVLHCAGVVAYGRTDELDAETFDQVLRTDLVGTVNVCRHAVRAMRHQGHGSIVVVGSLLGHISVPDMTPYVVSKWAVRALTRQLALENRDVPDLHISHVAPGSVDTPIYDSALDDDGDEHRPPPPVISAERVADIVVSCLDRSTGSVQTALPNLVMLAAHQAVPAVWDRLVGPAFDLIGKRNAG